MHPIRSPLQPLVEQRIGRNLLRNQLVELRLKALLPLREVDVSEAGLADLKARSQKLQNRTLGQLVAGYLAPEDPAKPSERARRIDAFVANRNWLTHHLLVSHSNLQTDADCQACIERLDTDYAAAGLVAAEIAMVSRVNMKMVNAFLEAWESAGADLADGTALAAAMKRHLEDESAIDVTVVFPPDTVENILAAVMRRLNREHHDAAGWTRFSDAGRVARREAPDLPKKSLLGIARQLEGFEFEQRPPGNPNGSWVFRVKR